MSKPPTPKILPLDRKVPKSEKYAAVEGVVDTGFNMKKFMEIHRESSLNARFHKEELFKRVKCSALISLIREYGFLWENRESAPPTSYGRPSSAFGGETPLPPMPPRSYQDPPRTSYQDPPRSYQDPPRSYQDPPRSYQDPPRTSYDSPSAPMSPMSTQRTHLAGGDWMSPVKPSEDAHTAEAKKWIEQPDCPYLLLDVRDREQYDKCHIRSAISYPAPMLSRSVNPLIPELYAYKNKEKSMIIIYDDDEKIASPLGNQFFEKQFDNVYVLNYGLRKFAELARELVVGEPPPAPPTTVKKKPSRSSLSTPSSARSLSSNTSFSSRATMRSTATSDTKAWK